MNQKGLRLVGGAIQGGMRDIPAEFLLHCRTYQDALRIGIKFSLSRLDECRVAERMGMSKGHLNKIINCDLLEAGPKRKMMSEYQMEQFEEVVGNNALSKYWVLSSSACWTTRESKSTHRWVRKQRQGGNSHEPHRSRSAINHRPVHFPDLLPRHPDR